ncbi:hypothetical protein EJB05_18431 [Eragrostis curvula]|uniref:laccase n=1 Tax=Eragrostis curvula TaxID=38414 RepID=A0A5J9VLU6_9POAL|nr:hypothetical protein EJB05_18431 [Eragrostis curvula]
MVQLLLAFVLLLVGPVADAATAKYTFTVGSMRISQLCKTTDIIAVNGQLPGPAIEVNEGDAVVVNVINASPYNLTIHWHGVLQLLTPWADGPSMVSQCPIQPNSSYTYRFSVPGQEGTLWWHAHSSFLRATVYGAFIVRPRPGNSYPFPAPDKEVPIVLGEWWNQNVVDVENDAILAGQLPVQSDAFTINGKTGLLYQCANETFTVDVEPSKTVLLRVINAGLNAHLFFKLAGHNFTVVAVDAGYTSNLNTDTLVLAPGQTVDALVTTNAAPGSYYMAVQAHDTLTPSTMAASDATTASAILRYNGTSATATPAMPTMPNSSDAATANAFYFGLRGLATAGAPAVPATVDVSMTIELGLGQIPCDPSQTKCTGNAVAAAMNGVSFRLPSEAHVVLPLPPGPARAHGPRHGVPRGGRNGAGHGTSRSTGGMGGPMRRTTLRGGGARSGGCAGRSTGRITGTSTGSVTGRAAASNGTAKHSGAQAVGHASSAQGAHGSLRFRRWLAENYWALPVFPLIAPPLLCSAVRKILLHVYA